MDSKGLLNISSFTFLLHCAFIERTILCEVRHQHPTPTLTFHLPPLLLVPWETALRWGELSRRMLRNAGIAPVRELRQECWALKGGAQPQCRVTAILQPQVSNPAGRTSPLASGKYHDWCSWQPVPTAWCNH